MPVKINEIINVAQHTTYLLLINVELHLLLFKIKIFAILDPLFLRMHIVFKCKGRVVSHIFQLFLYAEINAAICIRISSFVLMILTVVKRKVFKYLEKESRNVKED